MRVLPVAGLLLMLAGSVCHAQKPLSSEPDEGGIGGTGHGIASPTKPELIERPEMPERIERVESVERMDSPNFEYPDPPDLGGESAVEVETPVVDQP